MAKHITLSQLQSVMTGMATKNDARFRKLSDNITKSDLADALVTEIEGKLDEGDLGVYAIEAQQTPETGYIATYQLFKTVGDGQDAVKTAAGAKINIPKDFLVKSVSMAEVSAADKASGGKFEDNSSFAEGDQYIDFVVNTKDSDAAGTATHLYLNVNDLIDAYTAGDGVDITSNEISVVVDSSNANGLSVSSSGLAMDTASSSTTGALTSTDWSTFNGKQDAVSAGNGIDVTSDVISAVVDTTNANGLSVGASGLAMTAASASATGALTSTDWSTFNGKQDALSAGSGIDATSFAAGTIAVTGDLTAYTGTGAVDITNHVVSVAAATASTSGVGGNAGTMSAADKEKLDSFTEATDGEIQAIINGLYTS